MSSFFSWVKKFKEWIIISFSIIFSFLYFFLKNRALKPPDNSKIKEDIDKNTGKIEVIDESIEGLKLEESNLRKEIGVQIKKEDSNEESVDEFFKNRGF